MKEQFFMTLSVIAERAKTKLTDIDFEIYGEEFEGEWEEATKALKSFFKQNIGRPRLPSINELKSQYAPVLDETDSVEDILEKIVSAISMYGYTNANAASNYIGPIGWASVGGESGWRRLCFGDESQLSYEKSSLRKVIATKLKQKMNNEFIERKSLGSGGGLTKVNFGDFDYER